MYRKTISLVVLIAFINLTLSCYVTKMETKETIPDLAGRGFDITSLMTVSGEALEFPKERRAVIEDDKIVWEDIEEVSVDKADIKRVKYDLAGEVCEVIMKDGRSYPCHGRREQEGRMILLTLKYRSLALSEVEYVVVKKVDSVSTFFAVVGVIGLGTLAGLAIYAAMKESCPFVYSFDGDRYVFDAEPYGGAICQGLQRTEWCGLGFLQEAGGQYRMRISNEVDETQYTDELKLLVVDHPEDVTVVPDESGNIHTLSEPVSPVRAYDKQGTDLLPLVSTHDWKFWQTRMGEKDLRQRQELKDELIFEFPKPKGAVQAKLLFNGCTTLWGSQMIKRFLKLHGNTIDKWYQDVNSQGSALNTMMNWISREELYRLQAQVKGDSEWLAKGSIVGGGPFVSEDKVYMLDLADIQGDTLRIKLTPPATFWQINYIAIDYSDDVPVMINEIEAIEARDAQGLDVRSLLAQTDHEYLVMPDIGDVAELTFQAPARSGGLERSFVLKTSGYYDIHLGAQGEPQTEILSRLAEPGFFVQYAIDEYLKCQKERMVNR